jgi:phosphopantetheine--protein transferase-like protein
MKTCWVGNDIVDLADPDGQLESYDDRFVSRVCSQDEIDFLDHAEEPESFFWQIWTAKETAFKIYQRLSPRESFQPKHFEVNVDSRVVIHSELRVGVEWMKTREVVFCSGYLKSDNSPRKFSSTVSRMNRFERRPSRQLTEQELKSAQTAESCAVRILAKDILTQTLRLHWENLEIIRPQTDGDWLPPEIIYKGLLLQQTSLSMTHHGRFYACTISSS